jgi:hypothetical protein
MSVKFTVTVMITGTEDVDGFSSLALAHEQRRELRRAHGRQAF